MKQTLNLMEVAEYLDIPYTSLKNFRKHIPGFPQPIGRGRFELQFSTQQIIDYKKSHPYLRDIQNTMRIRHAHYRGQPGLYRPRHVKPRARGPISVDKTLLHVQFLSGQFATADQRKHYKRTNGAIIERQQIEGDW